MAITYHGKKVTATQVAKLLVWDRGVAGACHWHEDPAVDYDQITADECGQIASAVDRQIERVRRCLSIDILLG